MLDVWPDPASLINRKSDNNNPLYIACILCDNPSLLRRFASYASPQTFNTFVSIWNPIFVAIDALRISDSTQIAAVCECIRILIQSAIADRSLLRLIGPNLLLRASIESHQGFTFFREREHIQIKESDRINFTPKTFMNVSIEKQVRKFHTHANLLRELQKEFDAAVLAQITWPNDLKRTLGETLVNSLLLPIPELVYIVCDYSHPLANNGVNNNSNEFAGKQRPVFTPYTAQ